MLSDMCAASYFMHHVFCLLQVEAIKSRVGALYTFGQPRVGDYEVRDGPEPASHMVTEAA